MRPCIAIAAALVIDCTGCNRSHGRAHAPSSPVPVVQAEAPANTRPPDVLPFVLDNGLRGVVVRSTLSSAVSVVVNYQVGSNEAPRGYPGTAHALEHMMFRGSPGLSADQLAAIAAALGGEFNADTAATLTQYFFTIPAADLYAVLHIEAQRMNDVVASPDTWALERGAIEQEVARDVSDPEYVLYTKVLEALFQGTPYAHDALGTVPSFQATTASMLRGFHNQWYAPNNTVLVIAGSVDLQQVVRRVKEIFGRLPRRRLPERPAIALGPVRRTTFRLPSDRATGLAMIAIRLPGARDADFAASRVLADILDSHRGPVYALVPEGKVLDAGFELDAMQDVSLGYAWAEVPPGQDPSRAVRALQQAVDALVARSADPDLVAAARRRAKTDVELQKTSILGSAMAWSRALALEGRSSPDEIVRAVEQVQPQDVERIARTYLNASRAVVGMLLPAKAGAPATPARAPAAGTGEIALAPRAAAHGVQLPTWAADLTTHLEVPASAVHPTAVHLDNGIELIVQPERVSATVSIYGHIRNEPGMQTPPGREGVGRVLDQLLDYGTATKDRLAFQAALDEIGAREESGTDFTLQLPRESFAQGMALLADAQLRPRLPGDAFAIVRHQVEQAVRGELASPAYRASRALRAALYPDGDPERRDPTPATVRGLSLQDVRAYYQAVFRPDLTTIVVIGDTSPDGAEQIVEDSFGAWRAQGVTPDVLLPSVPLNRGAVAHVADPSRVQDEVVLAETLGLVRSDPDYYAVELGNRLLGGGFYASRLYRELREQRGLVYHVASMLDVRRTRGDYQVEYGCDPDKTALVRAAIERELGELATTPPNDSELRQAKALLLREIPLDESSEESIARGFIERVELGLPLDEPQRAARRYLELEPDHVQRAFARFIRPHALVEVVRGPVARSR